MRVQISSRRIELPDAVMDRTRDQLQKLTRYEPDLRAAEVIFKSSKRNKSVEAVLHIDSREPKVATGEGDTFQGALDQLVDRLGRMLRRGRDQRRDHQGPRLSEPVSDLEE
ncbi:MAG: ribosome hibernation-promoting factor, HPF/YfiA family [Longimicrobiales bacterium]